MFSLKLVCYRCFLANPLQITKISTRKFYFGCLHLCFFAAKIVVVHENFTSLALDGDTGKVCKATTNSGSNSAHWGDGKVGGYIEALGTFVVCGGRQKNCYVYNLTSKSWSMDGALSKARYNAAAVVIDNKLYVTGGESVRKT